MVCSCLSCWPLTHIPRPDLLCCYLRLMTFPLSSHRHEKSLTHVLLQLPLALKIVIMASFVSKLQWVEITEWIPAKRLFHPPCWGVLPFFCSSHNDIHHAKPNIQTSDKTAFHPNFKEHSNGHLPKEWAQRESVVTAYAAVERKSISPFILTAAVFPQAVHWFPLQNKWLCNQCFIVWLEGLPETSLPVRNRAENGSTKKHLDIPDHPSTVLCIDSLTQETEGGSFLFPASAANQLIRATLLALQSQSLSSQVTWLTVLLQCLI